MSRQTARTGRPLLVVFLGGLGGSEVEAMVGAARRASSLDSIELALSASGGFRSAILVTDDPSLDAGMADVVVDAEVGDFHFGRRLAGVLRRHGAGDAVYMGGGSVPLFSSADFAAVAQALAAGRGVSNNAYSSDLVAIPLSSVAQGPERVLHIIEGVERDNALSRTLAEGAGITIEALPRTYVTQMDIDGPTDLAVLSLAGCPRQGGRLRAYLDSLSLDTERYRRVLPLFTDARAQIIVAGRVGSHAWQYLERETACRVRLFAEERGMEAEGRLDDGSARSLLGFYLEEAGVPRFFKALAQLGDAAFIDTRVLLAHKRVRASREDRFLSDLGRWREVRDPFLREFTQAALEAAIPVLLGGHSLMSGGLMALNEHAWRLRDEASARP